MYRVAALLYPQALTTSITLPLEILTAAAQIAQVKSRLNAGVTLSLAAADAAPVSLFGGITLTPDINYRELPPLDLLIVPAVWRNPRPVVKAAGPLLSELIRVASEGTRVCAVGTGACLLAEAGLLDGRPATTHWNYLDRFATDYPKVLLKSRHLITQSDNIYCVGSVNSIADLMVHVVEEWYGHGVARSVENQFSPEIRRPFRAAAYQTDDNHSHHDEVIMEAQHWLQDNLPDSPTLTTLAAKFGLSTRTLNRRFHQATGMSPQAWLQRMRIHQAKELLRHSNLSIAEVGWQLGLQDVSHFGKLFREHVAMTPGAYREAVRGKLFIPERT